MSDSSIQLGVDDASILADFAERMTPTEADRFLGVANGTTSAAIRRGEIRPYRFPDAPKRAYVTPRMLAGWLEGFCRGDGAARGEG